MSFFTESIKVEVIFSCDNFRLVVLKSPKLAYLMKLASETVEYDKNILTGRQKIIANERIEDRE